MDRRDFLKTLGIGGGAICFAQAHPWIFSRTVIPYEGPFTYEWMAAEISATIAARLSGMRLIKEPNRGGFLKERYTQLSESFIPQNLNILSLEQIRKEYIDPVALRLADSIAAARPSRSIELMLPRGLEVAINVDDETTGIVHRFVRSYEIERDRMILRSDVCIA